jgi:plastocyanin
VAKAQAQQPTARPGAIRGRVDLRRVAAAGERRPTVTALGAPRERDLTDRLKSVVYLEAAPRGAFEQSEPGRAVMDQRNETFVPHVLAITTGTVVRFPNNDPFYHNVFSLSGAATFDLGRYAPGKTRSQVFRRPGLVKVYCRIHSHMSASILVLDHPHFTVPDLDGAFTLNDVPPGTYSIVGWHERIGERTSPVHVPAGGAISVDLSLPADVLEDDR